MVQFIAVVAVLVLATTPAIARQLARRKLRKDVQIDVAAAPSVHDIADPDALDHAGMRAASGESQRRQGRLSRPR